MITHKDLVQRASIWTDMQAHLQRLYDLTIKFPKDKVVVELGVRWGTSTIALLAAVNDSGGHLFSVDIEDCSNVCPGEVNWTFILGNDMDVVRTWNQPIDHLFIDTIHTFDHTFAELSEWGKWVKLGGVISLHDTAILDVMNAIEKLMADDPHKYDFRNYTESNGLGVLQKTSS